MWTTLHGVNNVVYSLRTMNSSQPVEKLFAESGRSTFVNLMIMWVAQNTYDAFLPLESIPGEIRYRLYDGVTLETHVDPNSFRSVTSQMPMVLLGMQKTSERSRNKEISEDSTVRTRMTM
jgi:hypothetical protein